MMKIRSIITLAVLGAVAGAPLGAQQGPGPVIALDPSFAELVPHDAVLEKLAGPFTPSLEGGVWSRRGNFLLFSNKAARLINKWTPESGVSVYMDLGKITQVDDPDVNLSSGTTFDAQGRLVYASQGERAIIRVEADGKRTVLADSYQGTKFGSPNDLVINKRATIYFTDNPRDATNGAYMLKDGKVTLVTRGELRRPNGIGLSPDEKVLYVNDSGGGGRRCVWRFDIQPDDMPANGRLWVDMSSDQTKGIPDGMKIDTHGNVWDGGPGGIWVLSPDGKHIGTIRTPDQVANLAFGDNDGKSLYMTLHSWLYRLRVNVPGLVP